MNTYKLIMLLLLGSISTLFAQNNEIQGVLKLPTIGATTPAAPNGKVLSLDNNNNVIVTTAGTGGASASNVYTIGLASNSLQLIGATATVSNASGNYLDNVINNAISLGYKKIYIQEGVYLINNSIILNRNISTLSEGITIEGAGKNTIVKPIENYSPTIPFFDISFSERNSIRNIALELKTSNTNVAKTAIQIGNGAQRNTIENLFIRGELNTPQISTSTTDISPILISANQTSNATDGSTKGFEADYNYFNNIFFQACPRSIVLDIKNSGVFNHNTFSNFHLDHFQIGIDFTSCSDKATIEGNLFSAFDCQALGPKSGENRLTSKYVVKGIMGANNTFQNFNIADWNGTQLVYVFEVTSNAERTVIENTECEGNITTGSDMKPNWYIDNGKGTQFINNANTNRITDYLLNNLNDVQFRGQNVTNVIPSESPTMLNFDENNRIAYKNFFGVRNFGSVFFGGRKQNVLGNGTQSRYENSSMIMEDFGLYRFGNYVKTNSDCVDDFCSGSLFEIRGRGKFQPHASGIYQTNGNYYINPDLTPSFINDDGTEAANVPLSVITNRDNNGTLQWTKISSLTVNNIYNKSDTIVPDASIGTSTTSYRTVTLSNPVHALEFKSPYSSGNITPTLTIKQGKVIIGNTSDAMYSFFGSGVLNPYKFIVNGRAIFRDEILIQSSGSWADYVFQDDYKLKSLSEVEDFINENGHLPNMPSAKEIETNGLPMAEITTKQQEKIEELTLYIIEQDKKIEALQKMKEEMDSLKKLVEKLNKN